MYCRCRYLDQSTDCRPSPCTPPVHRRRPLSHVCDEVEKVAPHQLQQQEGSSATVIRGSRQVGGQLLLLLLLGRIGEGLAECEGEGSGPIVTRASCRGSHGLHHGCRAGGGN